MLHIVWSRNALLLYLGIFLSIEVLYFLEYFEGTNDMSTRKENTIPDLWLIQRAHITPTVIKKLKENSCEFSVNNPFEPEILKYFTPTIANCEKYKTFYFKSFVGDGNPTVIVSKALPKTLVCCFEVLRFARVGNFKQMKKIADGCILIMGNHTEVPKESEYVVINCWRKPKWKDRSLKVLNDAKVNMTPVHRELLIYVPKPADFNVSQEKLVQNDHDEYNLNVIILGYDQISRSNFIRLMTRTFDYLKNDLDAIDLQGFNKIGDATLNNTLAMLTGFDYSGVRKSGWWKKESDTFDECPWIWKNFSNKGYVTDYADDYDSVFNYRFVGFRKQPTDYYMQPFAKYLMSHLYQFGSRFCIGNDNAVDLLLGRARKVAETLKDYRYFQFLWGSRVHELPGYAHMTDRSTLKTLKYFKEIGILNKSIVIMVSDHGWRAGPIMMNPQARTENRLPFAFFILPLWFRSQYPVAYENLVENQYRLTTPYDLHATILDILNMKSLQNPSLMERRSSTEIMNKSVSLFLPVPKTRTCKMANVDAMWCACGTYDPVSVDSPIAIQLAKFAVQTLNSWLKQFPQCYQYKLDKVISAEVQTKPRFNNEGDDENMQNDKIFRLVINVNPKEAKFEVVMFWNGQESNNVPSEQSMKMSTEVFRLNRYEASNCINVYLMKKICSCKDYAG